MPSISTAKWYDAIASVGRLGNPVGIGMTPQVIREIGRDGVAPGRAIR
jgi:hypothetical protein